MSLQGPAYERDFRQRMRRALYAAYAAGCSTVVLAAGRLGLCAVCGVFRNRPEVVAELWSEVLDTLEWRGRFARVVFAIPRGALTATRSPPRPPRAPAAGPLIPLYLLVRCFCPGCVRVASTWPCVHGVGP